MAHFIVELKQDGGCDYTIGCGTVLKKFEGNAAQAENFAYQMIEHYGTENINQCTVFEVSGFFTVDPGVLVEQRKAAVAAYEKQQELAQLQRLIAKHGVPK